MANENRLDLISHSALLAELTDRQAFLIKEWGHRDHYTRGFVEAVDRVNKALTVDAVEVVRCKDCKKGHPELAPNGGVWCAVWNHVFRDDEFCSKGERKDNGTSTSAK